MVDPVGGASAPNLPDPRSPAADGLSAPPRAAKAVSSRRQHLRTVCPQNCPGPHGLTHRLQCGPPQRVPRWWTVSALGPCKAWTAMSMCAHHRRHSAARVKHSFVRRLRRSLPGVASKPSQLAHRALLKLSTLPRTTADGVHIPTLYKRLAPPVWWKRRTLRVRKDSPGPQWIGKETGPGACAAHEAAGLCGSCVDAMRLRGRRRPAEIWQFGANGDLLCGEVEL